jgi:hypothetical protein
MVAGGRPEKVGGLGKPEKTIQGPFCVVLHIPGTPPVAVFLLVQGEPRVSTPFFPKKSGTPLLFPIHSNRKTALAN